jgi:hypothetical protein
VTTARFGIVQAVGICLLAAAAYLGYPQYILAGDGTHVTHGIVIVFLVGIYQVARGNKAGAEWIADVLVFLGLIGTVIGFIISLSGVKPDAAGDVSAIQPMVATLISGLGVALHTTLVGACAYLWIHMSLRLSR